MICNNCKRELRPGAKFCTYCGTKVVIEAPKAQEQPSRIIEKDGVSILDNYLLWTVGKGEIARIIRESDFLNLESTRGIIINRGTVADIYAKGQLLATVYGGKYDFISDAQLEDALKTRTRPNVLRQGWNWLVRMFAGESIEDKIRDAQGNPLKKINTIDKLIQHINNGELISITLRQERSFVLCFGDVHENPDGYADFKPIEISTPRFSVKAGLAASFKITDFNEFSSYYLTETNVASTAYIASVIAPMVKHTVIDVLGRMTDIDPKDTKGIVAELNTALRGFDFHGIALVTVMYVTLEDSDFERLTTLSRELYLSEKELEHLQRTNEFKNRLAAAINQQTLQEARTDAALYKALEEINKDKIIAEDELQRFYVVLSRERRIFDAQNQEMTDRALQDIRATGLLREEELQILTQQIGMRKNERDFAEAEQMEGLESKLRDAKYRNEFALKILQLHDAIDYEKARTGGEQEIEVSRIAHELNIAGMRDDYADSRFAKELDKQRQTNNLRREEQNYQDQRAREARQSQLDALRAIKEMEARDKELDSAIRLNEMNAANAHELELNRIKAETEKLRITVTGAMTAEQIAADRMANLSSEAQVAVAQSIGSGNQLAAERELREREREAHDAELRRNAEKDATFLQMQKEMMEKMMDTMSQMSGNMVENRNEQRREYRQELHREQERHDQHQDRALNYTTRVNTPAAPAPQPSAQQAPAPAPKSANVAVKKICPTCHTVYGADSMFCADCSTELELLNE